MTDIKTSVQNTLTQEADSVRDISRELDFAVVEKIVELLVHNKGMVFVAGCGTSGAAAKKIVHTLSCVECPAAFLSPADAVHGSMGAVREGDVVFLLSKGGATPEITQLVPQLKAKNAVVIAITENEKSELAQKSDHVLKIAVEKEPDRFNMLATSSTLTVIAVMDSIAICVMDRNGFSKEKFSVIHPGGAVGERLLSNKED